MKTKNYKSAKLILIIFGIITILIGGYILYGNINAINNYDQVTASVVVKTEHNTSSSDNHDAYVTYSYDGILYENVKLGSYDSTKMATGKRITLYVNPDNPGSPYYVEWIMGPIALVCGVAAIAWGISIKPKDE